MHSLNSSVSHTSQIISAIPVQCAICTHVSVFLSFVFVLLMPCLTLDSSNPFVGRIETQTNRLDGYMDSILLTIPISFEQPQPINHMCPQPEQPLINVASFRFPHAGERGLPLLGWACVHRQEMRASVNQSS